MAAAFRMDRVAVAHAVRGTVRPLHSALGPRTRTSMRSAKVAYDPSRPSRVLTVRDVMTTHVVTTSPDDPVADAAAAMVRQKVGSALIMQSRFLTGILTERAVLRAA